MNTTLTGDILEEQIFELLEGQIAAGLFFSGSKNCRVFRKKGYFSKDRGSDIIFDVSVEFYLPGATKYSFVMLVECKNYSNPVPVNDVEEFFAKVQQVASANAKAVMASNAAFQSGTRNYAESKGIGLLRYFDPSEFKWELYRSPSAGALAAIDGASENVLEGLSTQSFLSKVFDLYMQSPKGRLTNSLWDFVGDAIADAALTDAQMQAISNPRRRPSTQVPYLEHGEMEERSLRILHNIGYIGGEVSLDDICARETNCKGLAVMKKVWIDAAILPNRPLGRISFAPLEIVIYEQPVPNAGRDRFTLAHELAHLLLSHSRYISGEFCEDTDFSLQRRDLSVMPDVARMEYQANFFASCLLMPKAGFVRDFRSLLSEFGISNRGFGELYLDDQPCNYQSYVKITRELMACYCVSRAAASIRLEGLGLLRDVRSASGSQSTQEMRGPQGPTLQALR